MTMTSFGGFTAHRQEMLRKIGDYPAPQTPDGNKSKSNISAPNIDVTDLDTSIDDASDNKTVTDDGKADDTADGDKSKKSKKSKKEKKGKGDKDDKSEKSPMKVPAQTKSKKRAAVTEAPKKRRSMPKGT